MLQPAFLSHALCDFLLIWAAKYPIICIDHERGGTSVENALVGRALFESQLLQSLEEVLLPHSSCGLAAVQVLYEFQAVGLSRPFEFKTLRNFQIQVTFDVGLRIS